TIGDLVLADIRDHDIRGRLAPLRDEDPDERLPSLERLGVLADLSDLQRRALSQLIVELYATGDFDKGLDPMKRGRKDWVVRGRTRIRKLRKKLTAAQAAIDGVRRELQAAGVHVIRTVEAVLNQARTILDPVPLDEAQSALPSIDAIPP